MQSLCVQLGAILAECVWNTTPQVKACTGMQVNMVAWAAPPWPCGNQEVAGNLVMVAVHQANNFSNVADKTDKPLPGKQRDSLLGLQNTTHTRGNAVVCASHSGQEQHDLRFKFTHVCSHV